MNAAYMTFHLNLSSKNSEVLSTSSKELKHQAERILASKQSQYKHKYNRYMTKE